MEENIQSVMRLRRNHPDWSQKKIADELGIKPPTVIKYLNMARDKFVAKNDYLIKRVWDEEAGHIIRLRNLALKQLEAYEKYMTEKDELLGGDPDALVDIETDFEKGDKERGYVDVKTIKKKLWIDHKTDQISKLIDAYTKAFLLQVKLYQVQNPDKYSFNDLQQVVSQFAIILAPYVDKSKMDNVAEAINTTFKIK